MQFHDRPYIYQLYRSYGIGKEGIETLFVAGFGASMVLGTFVGGLADRFGRRRAAILYAVLYGASCLTKAVNSVPVLFVGRLLGGTATSILFSAFESWLIAEHARVRPTAAPQQPGEVSWLTVIFAEATLGNSLVAISCGVVAQFCTHSFGYWSPFLLAMLLLGGMAVLASRAWKENYGDRSSSHHGGGGGGGMGAGAVASFRVGWAHLVHNPKIAFLGAVQALFEGSMYCFVLNWTPALDPTGDAHHSQAVPLGWVFAAFMVCIMLGSNLFKVLLERSDVRVEGFLRVVLGVSAACFAVPVLFPERRGAVFVSFLVFEARFATTSFLSFLPPKTPMTTTFQADHNNGDSTFR